MLRTKPGLAVQEVQQKEIEGLRLRHIDSVSAPRRDMQGRSLDRRRKLFGHRTRHQHIVACRHQQGRQAQSAEMRRGIEGQQGGDAPLQGVGTLEACQSMRLFLFNPVSVLRQPVGRVEEDRLGAHIGHGSAKLQQDKPRLEASSCVGVRRRPAIDDSERPQAIGSAGGEIEARQSAIAAMLWSAGRSRRLRPVPAWS